MKPKLLYCLTLLGLLFVLSFTVLKREAKNSATLTCNKVEGAVESVSGSATEFILFESLTKYLAFTFTK